MVRQNIREFEFRDLEDLEDLEVDLKELDLEQAETQEIELEKIDIEAINSGIEAVENHLFNAGVAILQAAKTQEEILHTSIEVIHEALGNSNDISQESVQLPSSDFPKQIPQEVTLPIIWERLDRIEERLEYLISHLIPEPTAAVKHSVQLSQPHLQAMPKAQEKWTEKTLKKQYKTLATIRAELGIAAKTWKLAVAEANALTNC